MRFSFEWLHCECGVCSPWNAARPNGREPEPSYTPFGWAATLKAERYWQRLRQRPVNGSSLIVTEWR
jgi:hypothetical protein